MDNSSSERSIDEEEVLRNFDEEAKVILQTKTETLWSIWICDVGRSAESTVPERDLQPRNFNPHPYEATGSPVAPIISNFDHPYAALTAKFRRLHGAPSSVPVRQRTPVGSSAGSRYRQPLASVPTAARNLNGIIRAHGSHETGSIQGFAYTDGGSEQIREYHGGSTSGQYKVLLPDGRIQTVNYVADDDGYRADISYEQLEKPIAENIGDIASPGRAASQTATLDREMLQQQPHSVKILQRLRPANLAKIQSAVGNSVLTGAFGKTNKVYNGFVDNYDYYTHKYGYQEVGSDSKSISTFDSAPQSPPAVRTSFPESPSPRQQQHPPPSPPPPRLLTSGIDCNYLNYVGPSTGASAGVYNHYVPCTSSVSTTPTRLVHYLQQPLPIQDLSKYQDYQY